MMFSTFPFVGLPLVTFFLLASLLERLAENYQFLFQALTSFGILSIPLTWWLWKKKEKDNLLRNLSSVSVKVDDYGVAKAENTSGSNGTGLLVRIYKKEEEGLDLKRLKAENALCKKERKFVNFKSVDWGECLFDGILSIGEVVNFHLKDVQDNDNEKVHFVRIKLEIGLEEFLEGAKKTKYMLFRYASEKVKDKLKKKKRNEALQKKLNPYGKWVLIYSKSELSS